MAGEEAFKPGDVVQLKSGGPNMTVDFWDTTYMQFTCSWFEKTKRNVSRFSADSLQIAPTPSAPSVSNPRP